MVGTCTHGTSEARASNGEKERAEGEGERAEGEGERAEGGGESGGTTTHGIRKASNI